MSKNEENKNININDLFEKAKSTFTSLSREELLDLITRKSVGELINGEVQKKRTDEQIKNDLLKKEQEEKLIEENKKKEVEKVRNEKISKVKQLSQEVSFDLPPGFESNDELLNHFESQFIKKKEKMMEDQKKKEEELNSYNKRFETIENELKRKTREYDDSITQIKKTKQESDIQDLRSIQDSVKNIDKNLGNKEIPVKREISAFSSDIMVNPHSQEYQEAFNNLFKEVRNLDLHDIEKIQNEYFIREEMRNKYYK
jgi:flagellar motor switch/type III secretory pathway protein FliN